MTPDPTSANTLGRTSVTSRLVLTHVAGVLLRVAVVVGVDRGYSLLLERYDDSPDANIGLGLLGFVVLMAVAAVGGGWDGRRRGLARATVLWVVTAPVAAVAMVVLLNVSEGDADSAVLRSDLATLTPFLAGLLLVPAVSFALLASLTAPPRGVRKAR